MLHMPSLTTVLWAAVLIGGSYFGLLVLLTIPRLQTHVIYLHRIALTWFQDVNQPTQWGFLPNQVTPFFLETPDGERLHAWHILPIGLYQQHETQLLAQKPGTAPDISQTFGFKLLRDDPDSLLVLHFHGAAGTLGSGWRPPSYRAMHALAPNRIHTVAIDYRGFGQSSEYPTEEGLLLDARTLLRWAMEEAKIPSSRIVVFAQSLGTAVALSLAHEVALRETEPIHLKGLVLAAPFVDVAELTSTYRIAGIFPLLGPVSRWSSREKLAELIDIMEKSTRARYDITILHAKDDWDIPWSHSEMLFWHAVQANLLGGTSFDEARATILGDQKQLGAGGRMIQRVTEHGVLRQEIIEHGLHDRIMSYPRVSLAVWRAFQSS